MLKIMIQVNPKKRPNCEQLMEHPIIRKRSLKYFPEFEDEEYEALYAGQSNLLKTIRMPKNIMHLSSRLPKKNYDNSLDGSLIAMNPDKRAQGGANFRNQGHHNTQGKKVNLRSADERNESPTAAANKKEDNGSTKGNQNG